MDLKLQLWNAFKNREPVQLMNHYQGIPVSTDAIVHMLGHDVLAIKVDPRYLAVIRRERCTYMDCGECQQLLKANPIAYEAQDGMVVLSSFGVVNSEDWQRHWMLRIKPKETVNVTLDCTGREMIGRLLEIHHGENSDLHLRVIVEGLAEIKRDSRIGLSLEIPGDPSSTLLNGTAGRVNRQNRLGVTRLQIQVEPDGAGDGKLSQYFNRRKEEIEAEWLSA